MYPSIPYKTWIKFRDKNGLNEVTLHGLRHSWCTAEIYENKFLTDVEVSQLMGHGKNIDITKHYVQPIDSRLDNASKIFAKYEEDLKTNKGSLINFTYEELITILSGKTYVGINEVKNIISRYYNIDNVSLDEITARLLRIHEDLLSYDNYYYTIDNYLLNNNDWDILTSGKDKFGTEFSFVKTKLDDIKLNKDNLPLPKIP